MKYRPLFLITLLATLTVIPVTETSAQLLAPVKLIRGRLLDDKTGQPVDGGRVWVYQGTLTEAVTNSRINPADGSFQVLLDASTEYRLNIVSPRYYRHDITIMTPPEVEYEEVDTLFRVPPIPLGEAIFRGRIFEPGSSTLTGTDRMAEGVAMLRRHPNVTVKIAIVPDAMGKPKAPSKPPKKVKKKKGAPPPPEPPPPPPPVDLSAMGTTRQVELKNYFKSLQISVTRLTWEILPGVEYPAGTAPPLPANVTISINGIEPLDDDDDE